jgi:hypothetical protein
MTQLSSGRILGGEQEPDPLGLGFTVSTVSHSGFALGWGVVNRSLIMRLVVPLVRGSIAGDPHSPYVAEALLGPATVNGVMPSNGLTNRPRSTDVHGL